MVVVRPLLHGGAAVASLVPAPSYGALLDLRGGGMDDQTLTTRLLSELLGTFGLLTAVCLSGKVPPGWTRPIQVPVLGTLACLIFIFSPLSGASFNPAVNLSLLIGGQLSLKLFVLYGIMQFIGAAAATKFVALLG